MGLRTSVDLQAGWGGAEGHHGHQSSAHDYMSEGPPSGRQGRDPHTAASCSHEELQWLCPLHSTMLEPFTPGPHPYHRDPTTPLLPPRPHPLEQQPLVSLEARPDLLPVLLLRLTLRLQFGQQVL